MTTWFDRLRGEGQGRTKPKSFVAPHGEHVFVLGADGQTEEAILQGGDPALFMPGDMTEIKQMVDLTNWDLVAATMDTVGVTMGQGQAAPGLGPVPSGNALWWFNYDIGVPTAKNLVSGGFDLLNQGDIEVGVESYSPAATRCRVIPVGSMSAYLLGANTPQWMTSSPLDQYTAQFWINFDAASHPTSWGVSPSIFNCVDGTPNGWSFSLTGLAGPGAHSWVFSVGHFFGGASVTGITTFVIDSPNPGWVLVSLVWDITQPLWDRLRLYINDNPTPYTPFAVMFNSPQAPAPGTAIQVAHPWLYGGIDEMRMLDIAMTPAEIAASYLHSISWPTPVDYEWVMQIIVNDEVYAERTIRPSERRRWTDFKAPVRHLTGLCEVGFRLGLREVP